MQHHVVITETRRFSVLGLRAVFPVAKDGAVAVDEAFFAALPGSGKPLTGLGSGDSALLFAVARSAGEEAEGEPSLFEQVRDEVDWKQMMHKGSAVPRLVCIQGTFTTSEATGERVAEPVYRHPADVQPPMQGWSSVVERLRKRAEVALSELLGYHHPLNHALVQYYRDGGDYISEHADKTLDVHRGSAIVNLSLGATRTMVLRGKKEGAERAVSVAKKSGNGGTRPTRLTQRISLVDGSLFVLGWETNRHMTHEIRLDKRLEQDKSASELAFGGQRISLTFRHVATFMRLSDGRLWGQGAVCKSEAALDAMLLKISSAPQLVQGRKTDTAAVAAETGRMIEAFGVENRSAGFDWLDSYGGGFSVLNMASASELDLSPAANLTGDSEETTEGCTTEAQRRAEAAVAGAVADALSTVALTASAPILSPHAFFLAWCGVLVLAFEGFPPSLSLVKQHLNKRQTSRENFGSMWPKATLAATKDGSPPLALADLASLRRLCAQHSTRLAAAVQAEAEAEAEAEATCVRVAALDVVHYTGRGLEAALRPVRRTLRLAQPATPLAPGGVTRGVSLRLDAASASERARVRGVLGEWCGDRLSAYLTKANGAGSEASTYRHASPHGSTLVAFLDQPFSDQLETGGRAAAGLPLGLGRALASFKEGVESLFPGRFAWLDVGSLHCTLRSLDA